MSGARPTVVWFRRDLRVADHPGLARRRGRRAGGLPVRARPGAAGQAPPRGSGPPAVPPRRTRGPRRRARLARVAGSWCARARPRWWFRVSPQRPAPHAVTYIREVSPLGRARDARVAVGTAMPPASRRGRPGATWSPSRRTCRAPRARATSCSRRSTAPGARWRSPAHIPAPSSLSRAASAELRPRAPARRGSAAGRRTRGGQEPAGRVHPRQGRRRATPSGAT